MTGGATSASGGAKTTSGGAKPASGGVTNGVGGGQAVGGTLSNDAGAPTDEAGAAPVTSGVTIAEFVGVNGFIDDDKTKLAAVGNVREYHQWSWTDTSGAAYPNNPLEFSRWNGFWDFDDYYRTLRDARATVLPCLQGSIDALGNRMPPIAENADAADPASYLAHASLLYQYGARYGSTQVPDSALKLADGQVTASGLGLLSYFENGNEPDANWVNSDGSFLFEAADTAAMSSADYDGDQGRLGAGIGLKTADPHAKLVLAGLAGAGSGDWVSNITSYLDGIKAWSASHRGGSFPADVLNVHLYCFGPDPFGTDKPRPAITPEACDLAGQLHAIAQYRDRELPGKELWLTEFGYDTHPRSRLRAPAIGQNSAEVVQGQWLLRSILALLPTGIQRAFLFVSRDSCTGDDTACPDNNIQFATSGIMTQKGDEAPKPAWYFLATLRSRLGAYHYQSTQTQAGVSVVSLRNEQNRNAYVLWSPTGDGTTVPSYELAISGTDTVTVVTLDPASTNGHESSVTVAGGKIQLEVTETPVFVLE